MPWRNLWRRLAVALAVTSSGAISSLITAILPAAAYHLLRTEKEGAPAETIARAFD